MGLILRHMSGSGAGGLGDGQASIGVTGSFHLTSSIVHGINGGSYLGGGFLDLPRMSLSSMITGRAAGKLAPAEHGALFVASSSAGTASSLWFMNDSGVMTDIIGAGNVDGSGAANRGTYWADADTVTSSGNWTFDGSAWSLTSTTYNLDASGAVTIDGSAGLSIDNTSTSVAANLSHVGAAGVDLTIDASASSLILNGGEAAADAIRIEADNAAGGIDIDYGTGGMTIDGTGVFSVDVTTTTSDSNIKSAAGKVIIESGKTGADAVTIQATHAAGGVLIDVGTGGLQISDDAGSTDLLNIDGDSADFHSTVTVNIDNTTNSTSNTTGGLIVDGGVGIAKDVHIGGLVDIDGRVQIGGDLTVQGTTTTIDTTNLEVEDKLIGLNYTSGSSAGSLADAGLVIGNSGGNQQAFFWDNTESEFAVAGTASGPGDSAIAIADYSDFKAQGISAQAVTGSTLMITPKIISAAALDIDAGGSGKLTLDGPGGIDIGQAANVAVDLNSSTLLVDTATTANIRVGTAGVIAAGTTLYVSGAGGAKFGDDVGTWDFDGDGAVSETGFTTFSLTPSSTVDVDSGGAITVDGASFTLGGDSDTAGIAMTSTGAAASLLVASAGDAQDLTIGVSGATNSSVVVSSSGTGSDAISLAASAGDIKIATATLGKTITLAAGSASSGTGYVLPRSDSKDALGRVATVEGLSSNSSLGNSSFPIAGFYNNSNGAATSITMSTSGTFKILPTISSISVGAAISGATTAFSSLSVGSLSTTTTFISTASSSMSIAVGDFIIIQDSSAANKMVFVATSAYTGSESSVGVIYHTGISSGNASSLSSLNSSIAFTGTVSGYGGTALDDESVISFTVSGETFRFQLKEAVASGDSVLFVDPLEAQSSGTTIEIGSALSGRSASESGGDLLTSVAWAAVYADYLDFNGQSNGGVAIDIGGTARIDLDADNDTSIRSSADDVITIELGGTDMFSFSNSGGIQAFVPGADNSYDLGASNMRFRNIYTGDLHLANERGNWTLVEESNMLTFRNNLNGKWYRMAMEEIDPTGRDEGMNGPAPVGSPGNPAGDPDWEM